MDVARVLLVLPPDSILVRSQVAEKLTVSRLYLVGDIINVLERSRFKLAFGQTLLRQRTGTGRFPAGIRCHSCLSTLG